MAEFELKLQSMTAAQLDAAIVRMLSRPEPAQPEPEPEPVPAPADQAASDKGSV